MLYALYRQTASAVPKLNFASGSARGEQIRDPGSLGFARAPQFFSSAVSAPRWAQCQLELGWIMRETLMRFPQLFEGPSIDERCHALEAALFMIGYDLRCLFPQIQRPSPLLPSTSDLGSLQPDQKMGAEKTKKSTWVPTSVPFVQLLDEYLACSVSAGRTVELDEFRQWQFQVKLRKMSTARAYCAPFRESELDLPNFSIQDLKLIRKGGVAGLHTLGATKFSAGDDREQVYLVDTFLTGCAPQIAEHYGVPTDELLVQAGCAGKLSSANLILRIGKAVGEHFELLRGDQPTNAFQEFFGQSLDNLESDLLNAAIRKSVTGNIPKMP